MRVGCIIFSKSRLILWVLINGLKTVGGSMTFINGHASTQKDMLVDKDGNCIVDFVEDMKT